MTPAQPILPFDLEWRPVPGYSNYAIREDGAIKRTIPDGKGRLTGKLMHPFLATKYRYAVIGLTAVDGKRTGLLVHVLVAKAFIGPAPSGAHEVAHNDGKTSNNHWRNLRWATHKENAADCILHGTSQRGERNPAAVLTATQVATIREKLADGIDTKRLAREFNISRSTIYQIWRGKSWKAS